MNDNQLYFDLLGLTTPWIVKNVRWDMDEGHIDVFVGHSRGAKMSCPECGDFLSLHDHTKERSWRHLDTCQLQTIVHASIPRVNCATHGVLQVQVPWAEPHARFTILFERFAIDVLQRCNQTKAAEILGLSFDGAHHIMERAVTRGLLRRETNVAAHIGVDEKAYKKGHSYFTVVSDLDKGIVLDLQDDRKQSSLDAYFNSQTKEEKSSIEAVCMDMWEPFSLSVRSNLPDPESKIVLDRFHIAKHMVDSVNDVRKQEHRLLLGEGNRTLTGSKYLWLFNEENIPDDKKANFDLIRNLVNKTARAWMIKEMLRNLWTYKSKAWAKKYFERWYSWAIRSRLDPVKKVAKMIKNHLNGILNFFDHRLTSAGAEGINSRIQAIKVAARGFRTKEGFKIAIWFHLGGLELYPRTS